MECARASAEGQNAATGSTGGANAAASPSVEPPPELVVLLRVWVVLGAQSFGGGTATQYLIYREFVERRPWLSSAEFSRAWAICQLAPGINLLALTTLIGWRLRGAPGVALSLLGLLLPSVLVTLAMTGGYAAVRELPSVRAAFRGMVPATVGLGLLLTWRIAAPILGEARREGRGPLLLGVAVLVASALALGAGDAPVTGVLVACAALGAVGAWWPTWRRRDA